MSINADHFDKNNAFSRFKMNLIFNFFHELRFCLACLGNQNYTGSKMDQLGFKNVTVSKILNFCGWLLMIAMSLSGWQHINILWWHTWLSKWNLLGALLSKLTTMDWHVNIAANNPKLLIQKSCVDVNWTNKFQNDQTINLDLFD